MVAELVALAAALEVACGVGGSVLSKNFQNEDRDFAGRKWPLPGLLSRGRACALAMGEAGVRVFSSYQFSIYHRWGKQVFTTSDPSQGWNGCNAPEGVYAWTITYRWLGRGGVEVGEVRSGTVVLGR